MPMQARQMTCLYIYDEAFNNSQDVQCYHKAKELEKWASLMLYYVCVAIG